MIGSQVSISEKLVRPLKRRRLVGGESLGRISRAVGTAPGTLAIDPSFRKPCIRLLAYTESDVTEAEVSVGEIARYRRSWPVVWVDVQGLGDETVLRELGELFALHKLALEDVVSLGQRAKVEPYDEDLFIVARMPLDETGATEQLSIFVGKDFVLTFQEHLGDCFEAVRERARQGKGRIRLAGAGYLAYALLDSVIDSYFPVLEKVAERLEELEEEVLDGPERSTVGQIHHIRRELNELRRAIWPHRDAVNTLLREPSPFISQETSIYLRDCYDHTIRVAEMIEGQREFCADLMATYLSAVSNRMNEVMKVLAIMGATFIPLSFIAGLYGMNFDAQVSPWNMPELGWYLGYPFALTLMVLTAVGLLTYFWKKGWFR